MNLDPFGQSFNNIISRTTKTKNKNIFPLRKSINIRY